MHRILALLSFETFILIAALLLFAYIKKNELGKLLQYLSASISIFIAVLMIGTVFTCCMPCYGPMGGHGGYKNRMDCQMGGGQGGCSKMDNMDCGPGGNCPMVNGKCSPNGGMKEDCCMEGNMQNCEMGEEHEIEIEINDDGKKDTIQKKVIIKKTK